MHDTTRSSPTTSRWPTPSDIDATSAAHGSLTISISYPSSRQIFVIPLGKTTWSSMLCLAWRQPACHSPLSFGTSARRRRRTHHHFGRGHCPVLKEGPYSCLGYSPALRHDNNQTTLVLPATLRLQVFDSLHGLGHLGKRATAKLISQRYVWPGVRKDCRTLARACESCHQSKISEHTTTPLGDFALPTSRFQHVHIDIVVQLPTSDNFQILPYGSKSLHSLSRSDSHAGLHGRDGDPSPTVRMDNSLRIPAITTYQGRQFESQLFNVLANLCGIHLSCTTAFHPASSCLV